MAYHNSFAKKPFAVEEQYYSPRLPTDREAFVAQPPSQYRMERPAAPSGSAVIRDALAELPYLPLDHRFNRLHQLFARSDGRDIQGFFQPAVEMIFGIRSTAPSQRTVIPNYQRQWSNGQQNTQQQLGLPVVASLVDITTDYKLIFEAGYALLCAGGPLFRYLISVSPTRGSNLAPRFEFPVTCLPYSVQSSLANGMPPPPWYRDKIQSTFGLSDMDNPPPDFISLTAFDFFFAHFAYHLVNQEFRSNNPANPECLFMALVDNYSDVFFNADGILENQRVLSMHTSAASRASRTSLFLSPRREPDEHLGRNMDQRAQFHPLATSENLESLINIFVEFWTNLSGFNSQRLGRKYQNRTASFYDPENISPTFGQSPLFSPGASRRKSQIAPTLPTVFPPTSAFQAFRQVIKALHEFIYAPSTTFGSQRNMETSLLDMKRHIVPQLIQKPLYDLLKITMRKYPMDASFRYIYELWLTYLQPWRYEKLSVDNSVEEVVSRDQKWVHFVSENLLFYSTIFQEFVHRMLRVDFGVPFNTVAVFRVAKVFKETELYKLAQVVEDSIAGAKKSGSPYIAGFSPSKSVVRNHFADLEDTSFRYVPINSPETLADVTALMRTLIYERNRCQRELDERKATAYDNSVSTVEKWKGYAVYALKSLFGLVNGPIEGMQLRPEEFQRMSQHFTKAIENFCDMFEVDQNELLESGPTSQTSRTNDFLLDHEPTSDVADLSLKGIVRSRSHITRHSVPSWTEGRTRSLYLTPPELRAPSSWEVEFLVPLLNALSQRINSEYGNNIVQLYNGRDFLSRLLHPLIEPPHNPGRAYADRPALPARINLRPLASKYLLGSLLFAWFFMWLLDFGYIHGTFWLLAVPAFFLIANALLEPFRDDHQAQQ
ncbi:hypothetical protein RvY_15697 [Ramazzottius varieornatus]|uniref:Sphingomyelin phosphodiesterase 4 n=1 Tax=Ramazzottius varieornatus TaxID=947166 RepID=A0A1D1VYZ3_RAMVA|nr:hypothetical protein RvY_15697 [Ramazzottius varieornatus]